MSVKKVSSIVLSVCTALVLSTPAYAKTWTMKISHAGPVSADSDDHYGALEIKKFLDATSGGRINVEIYPASQLGSYKEVVEQVQAGALEVAHTSIDGAAPFVPAFTLVDLPYSMPDDETARKFMRGSFLEVINQGVNKVMPNVELISMCNGGNWRSFYTTSKAVNSVADLKGLKIRTINSPLQQELARQLGTNPTAVAWGELYTALATGVVNGLKIAINDITSNKMDEHVKNGILDKHTYLYGFYWINKEWLASMPQDLQKLVIKALKTGAENQSDFNEEIELKARAIFASNGGTIVEPTEAQRAEFMQVKDDMEAWYLEKYGNEGKKLLSTYKKAIAEAK